MLDRLRALRRELRRRKVGQVAGAYGAAALATALAVSELYDDVGLPDGSPTIVIVLLVAGFPVALTFAWLYDVRPERAADEPEDDVMDVDDTRPSIVVLPFDNISAEESDAYLSEGLTEEITADLSYVRALRVISRSSATALKASGKSVLEMTERMHVEYVLEGSVRKVGDSLRVTAQLIRASTDEHVWAKKYDGTMDDVFALQEEVARAIVRALEVEVSTEESRRLGERPMDDTDAYVFYLRAREETWRFTEEAFHRAHAYLERAQEIVGDNPLILAGFGYVEAQRVNLGFGREEAIDEAERYARRALELDPRSAQAHLVLGLVFAWMRPDLERSIHHLELSLESSPDDPHTLLWLIIAYSLVGRGEPIAELAERAVSVDPLTPMTQAMPGMSAWVDGRYDEVASHMLEWHRRDPENRGGQTFSSYTLAWAGEQDRARAILASVPEEATGLFARLSQALRYALEGRTDALLRLLETSFSEIPRRDPQVAYMLASVLALVDRKPEALDLLGYAIDGGFRNTGWLEKHDPFLTRWLDDDDYLKLIDRTKT